MEPWILLGIITLAVASFVFEWLPLDVTALAALGLLLLFELVTPEEAVAGFSNPAVVTVMMMFILSEGLVQSGLVARLGHRLARISGPSGRRGSGMLLGLTGGLSAFINNTATVSILMPVGIDLAKRYDRSPSKLLLPLSYLAIFGGTCTLIGTSTNLLVSALAVDHGMEPFTVFEFTQLGLLLSVLGMLYIGLLAGRVLPARSASASLTRKYRMSSYLTEVRVPEGSSLVGSTVVSEQVSDRYRLTVLEILRGNRTIALDIRNTPIEPDDLLLVRGSIDDIVSFKEHFGLLLLTDTKLQDADLSDASNVLAEVQLAPDSQLVGRTLKEIDFRKRYGGFVLALSRTGEVIRDKLAFVRLEPWDTLLVFGPRQRIEGMEEIEDFIPLQEHRVHLGRISKRWWVGALVIPLVVAVAALGWMSILKSAILGVVVLLVTRTVRIQQAYRAIDWTVIFLLAAILPLGTALENTGLADMGGRWIAALGDTLGPHGILALLVFLTMLVTGFISNNTAAVLMVPIVFSVAGELAIDPKPLVMGVAFAASLSFFTPMGYQTNVMVYGPGSYRFLDFVKFGGPLNVLCWAMVSWLVPWFWPF